MPGLWRLYRSINHKKMKTIVRIILIVFAGLFINSCKDDYLNKTNENITIIESMILVSPDWGSDSYPVEWPKAGNAKFTITDSPKWLKLASGTGQFIDGIAYINCSAIKQDDFQSVGIYNSYIQLNVDGAGLCIVQVGYVNEGNPTIESSPSIIKFEASSGLNSYFSLYNRSEGILIWKIVEQPEWISISDSAGYILSNSAKGIDVNFQPVAPLMTDVTGKIIIVTNSHNTPEYSIDVQYTAGTARFSCSPELIDFERSKTQQKFSIYSSDYGILTWTIDQYPDWITVSKSSGALSAYSSEEITLTCNRENLTEGSHIATITFKSNDKETPVYSILAKCHVGNGNAENITSIEGIVEDTEYDQTTGLLYLVTRNPDQLIVYDTQTKKIVNNVALDLAPTCIGIAENGESAVVGYRGMISHIDLKNLSVKYWELNFVVYDALLVDDWCLLSPEYDYGSLIWFNIETGATQQLLSSVDRSMSGKSILRKSPGKNLIIGTHVNISPSGIFLIDSQTKMVEKHFHVAIDPFWLSQAGDRIFTSAWHSDIGYGCVYRTPDISTVEATPIAKLERMDRFYNNWGKWAYHHESSNSLWVIANYSWGKEHYLLQYEATNYSILKQYHYSD